MHVRATQLQQLNKKPRGGIAPLKVILNKGGLRWHLINGFSGVRASYTSVDPIY